MRFVLGLLCLLLVTLVLSVAIIAFFAVATECFFERPAQMKAQYPELYEELKEFYRQDPVTYKQALPVVPRAGSACS